MFGFILSAHRADGISPRDSRRGLTRREFLIAANVAGWSAWGGWRLWQRHERGLRASVFIGRAESYDGDLAGVVRAGLRRTRPPAS